MLFGREREIDEIVGNCAAGRFVVLVHEPGMGATALLVEGVAPALRSRGIITIVASRWHSRLFAGDLKRTVAEAVREQADIRFTLDQSLPLAEMLRAVRAETGRDVAVVLDQFEDYLLYHAGTEIANDFDAELSNAIAGRKGYFAAALHGNFVPDFERLAPFIPNLLGFRATLGALSADASQQLLSAEGKRRGIEIEPAAMDSIIRASATSVGGGCNPFFLMAAAIRLLDAARERNWNVAGLAQVEMYGGPDRLVLESLDSRVGHLKAADRAVFAGWAKLLISMDGRRAAVTERALSDGSTEPNGRVLPLLKNLVDAGILRALDLVDGLRFEIARESMTRIISDWARRHEAALVARRGMQARVRSIAIAAFCFLSIGLVIWLVLKR